MSLGPRCCRLRAFILWLLAVVVPLQCSAGLVRHASGPLHIHAAKRVVGPLERVELIDYRRTGDVTLGSDEPAVRLSALLHGHAHPQRHHHVSTMTGMVAAAAGSALERLDGPEDGTGTTAI